MADAPHVFRPVTVHCPTCRREQTHHINLAADQPLAICECVGCRALYTVRIAFDVAPYFPQRSKWAPMRLAE